jgi:hypothetical protein
MRIDRVKYTAHYDEYGQLKDQWIGLEAGIDDTEVPEKQLDAIKEITEQWYRKQNPHLQPQGPPRQGDGNIFTGPRVIEVERISEDLRVAELIRDIYRCTEFEGNDGLVSYYKLASAHPEAQAAYDVMKNKLVAKEAKEILDTTETLSILIKESGLSGLPYESLDDNK